MSLIAYKTATSSSNTSNTVLISDPSLVINFGSTGWYTFEAFLPVVGCNVANVAGGTGANGFGGFQMDLNANPSISWSNPANAAAAIQNVAFTVDGYSNAAIGTQALRTSITSSVNTTNVSATTTSPSYYKATGVLQVVTPGTLGIRWAANVSVGNSVAVLAGAYFTASVL
jgi:hypothetical protein